MTILTSAQGSRYRSTYIREDATTKFYGNNPTILPISNVTSKRVRPYLLFNIPAVALAPTTVIASATLSLTSKAPWAHTHTIAVARCTAKWDASKLTWAKRPTNTGISTTATKATALDKDIWSFDVKNDIIGMQTAGNFGWEVRISAGTADAHALYNSGLYVAHLEIEYHVKPPAPTSISPGNDLAVSVPKPTLRIVSPLADHTAIKVQISTTRNGVAPDWETTYADAGTFSIDLAGQPGAPSLLSGASTSFRFAIVGTGGQVSDWSAWSTYTYIPFGAATLIEPEASPDNIVYDPSPPIIWDFANQTAYRLYFIDPSLPAGSNVIYDSNVVASDEQGASPGHGICSISGHTYRVRVRLWDDEARVSQGGVPEYVQLERDFVFQLDATVDPVADLVAIDMKPHPFVKLVWTRSTPADFYQVLRDGVQVAYLEAMDVLVSGDDYEWIDLLASPRRQHTWIVRAVVNNQTSAVNPSQTLTITPTGLWLSQPSEERFMPIITLGSQSVGLTEDGQTFTPLNSRYAVRVTGSKRSYSGTITGEILATELTDALTGSSLRDLFLDIRDDDTAPTYLTLLDSNIKIAAFNMTVAPTPTIGQNEDYVYAASFEFIEVP